MDCLTRRDARCTSSRVKSISGWSYIVLYVSSRTVGSPPAGSAGTRGTRHPGRGRDLHRRQLRPRRTRRRLLSPSREHTGDRGIRLLSQYLTPMVSPSQVARSAPSLRRARSSARISGCLRDVVVPRAGLPVSASDSHVSPRHKRRRLRRELPNRNTETDFRTARRVVDGGLSRRTPSVSRRSHLPSRSRPGSPRSRG